MNSLRFSSNISVLIQLYFKLNVWNSFRFSQVFVNSNVIFVLFLLPSGGDVTEEEDDSDEDSEEESDGDNDEDYDDPETGVPLDDSVCPPSKINNQLLREQMSCLHLVVHLCIVHIYYIYIYIT